MMPFLPPAPPYQQPVATVSQRSLYEMLRAQAAAAPALALEQAQALRSPELRDRIERLAFLAAIDRQPSTVLAWLPRLAGRSWLGEVGFERAVALESERLLRAAALANPVVAVREVESYAGLPFGLAVFEEAASLVPDEAIAAAVGGSPSALAVRAALEHGERPETRLLASLAADTTIPEGDRPKLGYLAGPLASGKLARRRALEMVRRDPDYFHTLAEQRIAATTTGGDRARWLDRALENYSLLLVRSMRDDPRSAAAAELERFGARDLRLLAAYGRAEDTEETFARLFDRYLLGKLRGGGVLEAPQLRLRGFLALALAHERLDVFLERVAPSAPERSRLLAQAVAGLDREPHIAEEAIAAAELIEGTRDRATLGLFAATLAAEYARVRESNRTAAGYYGLLVVRLAAHMEETAGAPPPAALDAIARRYRAHLREERRLDAAALFDAAGRCPELQLFYDDDDGVESFHSFQAIYAADPRWKWEDHGWYVRLSAATAAGTGGRRIEVFSNVPLDATAPGARALEEEGVERRRKLVERMRAEAGEPRVVIHRGHAYHLLKTLDTLDRTARLAYLGSCGSAAKVHVVVERAGAAQVIATRGVGTLAVNDPLLKAINDELLRAGAIDWPSFWQAQQQRFHNQGRFGEYIAPHRNQAAILLRGWEDWLAAGQEP